MTAVATHNLVDMQPTRVGLWAAARAAPLPAVLFIALLTLPPETSMRIGELRISPYRWVLLLTAAVALYRLCFDRDVRLGLIDLLIGLHAAWVILAISVVHDAGKAVASGGIYFVESFGAYLLARLHIRTAEDFRGVIGTLTWCVLALMLFSIPEMLTGQHFARDLARALLGGAPPDEMGQRFGLTRAYGPFEHPILYGVFCALSVGLSWVAFPAIRPFSIWPTVRTGLLMLATFASISSGALSVAFIQIGFIAWARMTRAVPGRWWALLMLGVVGVLAISAVSTRSPVQVLITTLAMSPETGYMRIEIFNYGSDEVARHPWWGIGFNDWQRPDWMPDTGSVDNFWLLTAMRYGMPALILLWLANLAIIWSVSKAPLPSADARLRNVVLFAVISLLLAGCTVHFWNALFALFFFVLGCTAWTRPQTAH